MSPSARALARSLALVLLALTAGCTRPTSPPPTVDTTNLTVLAPQSLVVDDEVIGRFEQESGISVLFRNIGPATDMVERIVEGGSVPSGWDLVYGIDNQQMVAAIEAGLFQPYAAAGLADVPDHLEIDSSQHLLPVSHNYVMVNADRDYFEREDIDPPASLDDLRRPEIASLLALPSPETDQAGRGFLAATARYFGEDAFIDFWADLDEGGAQVAANWTEAYLGAYTVGSSGEGDRPLVLAYASAPAADAVFTPGAGDSPPSVALDLPGAGFHQIDLVGIAADTPRVEQARALVEFLLGPEFQASVAQRMFAFPVLPDAETGQSFAEHARPPAEPVNMEPSILDDRMQSWLVSWQGAMAR